MLQVKGRLLEYPALQSIGRRHNATPAQLALAWVLQHDGVSAIPRARTPSHVGQNAAAQDVELTSEEFDTLDRAFPPPTRAQPLDVL